MIYYLLYKFGPLFIFLALTLGVVGLPLPDELLLLSSGILVAHHKLDLFSTIFAALMGGMLGITLSYFFGRWLGPVIVKKFGKPLHINEDRVNTTKRWFLRIGKWILVIGYFIPLFRHLVGFVAGGTKLDFRVFALYAYLGAIIWALFFLAIGYFLGDHPTEHHLFH